MEEEEEEEEGEAEDEEALLQWALSLGGEQVAAANACSHMQHTHMHLHATHTCTCACSVVVSLPYLTLPHLLPHVRRLLLPCSREVGRLKTCCATCGDARLACALGALVNESCERVRAVVDAGAKHGCVVPYMVRLS